MVVSTIFLIIYYAGCIFVPSWVMWFSYEAWQLYPDWWKPLLNDPQGSCFTYGWRVPIFLGVTIIPPFLWQYFFLFAPDTYVVSSLGAYLGYVNL